MAWLNRLFRRGAARHSSVVLLPDGTEVVLPKKFGELTLAELEELGIRPGMGAPSWAFVLRGRPPESGT